MQNSIEQKIVDEIELSLEYGMLEDFLYKKPLYYSEIDYDRMPRVYKKIKPYLTTPKIVHLIGTNGKGTTGRFLATALYNRGFIVGHYTSPHILKFNERVWLNGEDVSDERLEEAHRYLQEIIDKDDSKELSYFEYTTLLAMVVYQKCDYIVMEAGLGGEYDATAIFPKILTLITPIDYDHESFLGDTIEEIAKTKIGAIDKEAIVAKQKHQEIYSVADDIATQKDANIYKTQEILKSKYIVEIEKIVKKLELPSYLEENLKLAIAALEFLKIEFEMSDFEDARLFGRLSKIEENIYIDVGHNPLAAHSIAKYFRGQRVTLIYNSYKDKDYSSVLEILKPIISSVEIIDIEDDRIVARNLLEDKLQELKIEYKQFDRVLDKKSIYLIFGSFSVVEKFLKNR